MSKKNRWIVVLLVGVLIANIFTACGKQGVDYSFDEGTQSSESAETGESAIAERLGIPKSYATDIDPGDSELISITIKDDEIQVPITDSMRIEYLEGNMMDAAYRQKITSIAFGRDDEIYQFEYDYPMEGDVFDSYSKSDFEHEIRIAEWRLQYAKSIADPEWQADIEEEIAELEEKYEDAVDEHEPAGDWSASGYIGDKDDVQFRMSFFPYNGIWGNFEYHISFLMETSLYRPRTGTFQADYSTKSDAVEGSNQCVWSQEEAVEIAREFLRDCGITDVVVETVRDVEWTYSTPRVSNDISDISGYWIYFIRAIDGNEIYHEETYAVDTLDEGSDVYETYEIYVDDNGILEAFCYDMFRPTGQTERNVDLLSFEQVMEIARTVIPEYYTEHVTAYDSIIFNDIRLTYFLVNGEEENSFKYIPVWVFAESGDEYGRPTQLIMLDAVTGELVDLNKSKYVDTGSTYAKYWR